MCEYGTESEKSTDDLAYMPPSPTYLPFHFPVYPYGLKRGLNGFLQRRFLGIYLISITWDLLNQMHR